MNGAESLIRTLVAGGIEACFTNPGTSEINIVAALDRVTDMRCVLGLFEGVVTGAADGYARMARKPACTLLHLGPGFGNGIANLHNASRAQVPRSEEHTSELQSQSNLVCRLLLEKKKKKTNINRDCCS